MVKRIFIIVIVGLLASYSLSVMAANSASDEAMIKAVIKHVLFVEDRAKAKKVEFEGQIYEAEPVSDVLSELAEYASNKQGYIDGLKQAFSYKGANEKLYNARVEKTVFKDFNFKSIEISGDTATTVVDVSWEVTNHMGGQTTVFIRRDDQGNVIGTEVQDNPENDFVAKGTTNWTITLERINNNWQLLSRVGQF